jgi:hypothetical protein
MQASGGVHDNSGREAAEHGTVYLSTASVRASRSEKELTGLVRNYREWTVVITMIAMWMMQPSAD